MSEPLFSTVGRSTRPTEAKARLFHLVIVLGLAVAGGLFLAELGGATHLTVVEVDLGVAPEPPAPIP